MLFSISLLLACQLAGEIVTRGAGLPLPGPVTGLALLVLILLIRPQAGTLIRPTVSVILANLSLLFVPAGVGVIGNLDALSQDWPALVLVVVASTIFAMLAAVGTFIGVSRLVSWRAS